MHTLFYVTGIIVWAALALVALAYGVALAGWLWSKVKKGEDDA